MRSFTVTLAICVLGLAACPGCSVWSNSTTSKKDDGWSISKLWKKEYQKPQSLAAIWSPDIMTIPGQVPTRGFGGRIYFYNEKSQAVPVDGDLMVHGYLGQPKRRGQSEQIAADKAFAFTAEQLVTHFSPSEIGASYSIWVPWDAEGGKRQEITLIPTFKGKDGTLVQGAPAKVNLPGYSDEAGDDDSSLMQTVSYRASSTPTNPGVELPVIDPSKMKMRTMTIGVPPNSTIGKPKSANTYSLVSGNAGESLTPASNGVSGVSVGGKSSLPNAGPAPVSRPATESPDKDKTTGVIPQSSSKAFQMTPIDLKNLAPPPVHNPLQTTPFRLSPWTDRPSAVREASFNSAM